MLSYSLGTTSTVFGMWKLKEYYEQRVKLVVLLAPAIEFKFIKESVLANAAQYAWAWQLLTDMQFDEIMGPYNNQEIVMRTALINACAFNHNDFCSSYGP